MSADFDKAIDGAVREMLDVDPAAGLRQRVLEELPASGFQLPARLLVASSFSWKVLLPVAAAAVLVLAVLLLRGTSREPETTTVSVPQSPATAVTAAPVASQAVQIPHVESSSPAAPERRAVLAAVAPSAD